jgi:hypothetical protein
MLRVALDILVVKFTANKSFSVEDGVCRIRVEGIFCAVANTEYSIWSFGQSESGC